MTVKNYLSGSDSKPVTDILKPGESVLIACEVMEGSLDGKWSKRYLVLTTERLCNFTEDMQPNRMIQVS